VAAGWPAIGPAQTLTVDHEQVRAWNRFADALYALHLRQLAGREVVTEETIGGYATHPDFYREVRYIDAASGRLLSLIDWERQRPDVIHSIEVYQYAADGRLSHDFVAVYLPDFRNAPILTLVNVHHHDNGLHAFRQFDASGVYIYEQCRGHWLEKPVMISVEEDELPMHTGRLPDGVNAALYHRCFGSLPDSADPYLADLLAGLPPEDGGSE
jgi:hypothetical protein